MTELIFGLILFLGAHSVRIVADDWRTQKMEALGEKAFKGVHALISLLGLYLWSWAMAKLVCKRWCCGIRLQPLGTLVCY